MSLTAHTATFAGRARVFDLRIGEIGELETLCGAGVGAIYTRLGTLQFKHADMRETIRLGLIGGGLHPAEADMLTQRYVDLQPINDSLQLAADIMRALFDGAAAATKDDDPGEAKGSGGPATSPPSSPPASSQESAQAMSAA